MSAPQPSASATRLVFAGGGTGGHIFPNVAVWERLSQLESKSTGRFVVSERTGDLQTMESLGFDFSTSPVQPLPSLKRPWRALDFLRRWRRAVREAKQQLLADKVDTVVACGGFVSGPMMVAATRLGLQRVLINLDAVPGKANRRLKPMATKIFSVHACPGWEQAELISLPLRSASFGPDDQGDARRLLGLDPDRPTLLITGATHGAQSLIELALGLIKSQPVLDALASWQVFHQCGSYDVESLQAAYDAAGVQAKVVARTDHIGAAWRAATLALSRAGAGSVAEAAANRCPTVFFPNPYHADGHQWENARPLEQDGAAVVLKDHIHTPDNLKAHHDRLIDIIADSSHCQRMLAALEARAVPNGAERIAAWLHGERSEAANAASS